MILYRPGIETVLATCANDPAQFDELMRNPTEVFRRAGIPIEKEEGFNAYFINLYETQDFSPLLKHVRQQALSPNELALARDLTGQIASYPLAEQLVKMARKDSTSLNQRTELHTALGDVTGKSPDEVAQFVASLQPIVKKGVDQLVLKISAWRN